MHIHIKTKTTTSKKEEKVSNIKVYIHITKGQKMKTALKTLLITALTATTAWSITAIEVIDSVNNRDDGGSVTRNLKMVLTDKRGKERVQETFSYRKYYGEDKKSVIFYKKPKRLKGTGFLTYDNAVSDDEQWLYLPALRKVRRVSASDRGDWFLGTDFSYEDIKKETKVSKEDYDFKILGEENVDGHEVYKMESVAKSAEIAKELGYSKLISWIDKKIFVNRKAEFYDERGELLKRLHNHDITQVDGIWTIHHMEMTNEQNGHVSHFYFSDIDYKTDLSDSLFTQQSLKRGK